MDFPGDSAVKNSLANAEDSACISLNPENPLEKQMATHSSILPWDTLWRGAWWAPGHGVTKSQTLLIN